MNNDLMYREDQYGVRNYRTGFLAILTFGVLYLSIAVFALILLYLESNADGSNIRTYADAFWVLMMSASTIGFGDFYPITFGGRVIIALMFYLGVGLVGFIGTVIADRILGFADTNVKNRELRMQNAEILAHNQLLEKKLDRLISHIETKF
ncbi:MAG: potassium channel family protein [Oceanospirillaceae bacterium]